MASKKNAPVETPEVETPEIETPEVESPEAKAEGPHTVDEYRVEITTQEDGSKKIEKLKLLRENVVITEYEASVLNHGMAHGGNQYAPMYFRKGEDSPILESAE